MIVANNSNGLVMYDNDYMAAATYVENYCSSLSGIINSYVNTLQDIAEGAIVDQKICSALASLSNQTAPLMQIVTEIGEQVANTSRGFVESVDTADSFLY